MSYPIIFDVPQPSIGTITDVTPPDFTSTPEPSQRASHGTSQSSTSTLIPSDAISPSTAREFRCTLPGCGKVFMSDKDLSRHRHTHDKRLTEVNNNDPAPLGTHRCICGKRNPRLDNHRRHAQKCALKPRRGHMSARSYQCPRGHEHASLEEHLAHLQDKIRGCGKTRGRRPGARVQQPTQPPHKAT